MGALRIRRDDQVVVVSGKDKGRTGRVLRVDPARGRVYVEGVNVQKRHQRPRTMRDMQRPNQESGVIEREGPIHVSNVMLLDPGSDKPTRISVRREDGVRTRMAKHSGEPID
jgi:large subunit ribosomal protein L24